MRKGEGDGREKRQEGEEEKEGHICVGAYYVFILCHNIIYLVIHIIRVDISHVVAVKQTR